MDGFGYLAYNTVHAFAWTGLQLTTKQMISEGKNS